MATEIWTCWLEVDLSTAELIWLYRNKKVSNPVTESKASPPRKSANSESDEAEAKATDVRQKTGLPASASAFQVQTKGAKADRPFESSYFEKGIQLVADGNVIKTGWFGHAAPALIDLDRDGDLDLLVGQYTDGIVEVYKNTGSDKNPKYEASGKLKAGGEVASVETFCCVGFTPCIVDFDDDGHLDILSGSYPGELYIFRGQENGQFSTRENIQDVNGKVLKPGFATTAHAADIDGDGDFDLLSSLKKGGVAICYNRGTPAEFQFGEWEELEIAGRKIPSAHSGPVCVDFDGDGRQDLIVAVEENIKTDTWRSKLVWYRNTSEEGKPEFSRCQS